VLHYTWLERLSSDKHSSLLGPFLSYNKIQEGHIHKMTYELPKIVILVGCLIAEVIVTYQLSH
jgi:hypothetical protein